MEIDWTTHSLSETILLSRGYLLLVESPCSFSQTHSATPVCQPHFLINQRSRFLRDHSPRKKFSLWSVLSPFTLT